MSRKNFKTVHTLTNSHIQPKTEAQMAMLNAMRNNSIVVALGPAGVGKTYLAVNEAINGLSSNSRRKIILSRSNMPTGKSLGSFPGDIKDKLSPWLAPMTSEIQRRIGENNYNNQLRLGNIQMQPLETIRGCSFDNSDILFDEAQNLTFEEVKAISTRVGENSRLVFMGDPFQTDIREPGLMRFCRIMEEHGIDIPIIRFGTKDIVRSDIVRDIVVALMRDEGLE